MLSLARLSGQVWEAVAALLQTRRKRYVIVIPLAPFRVREAGRPDRHGRVDSRTDAAPVSPLREPAPPLRCRTFFYSRVFT
jgi:hypothetical protein